MDNPFTITFGREPFNLIAREEAFETIYRSFDNPNPSSQTYMIVGPRGCGKTVALTKLYEHYKAKEGWIVIDLNPEMDMLEQFASKLYEEAKLKKYFIKANFSFSFKGFGFQIEGREPVSNISTLLERMLSILQSKKLKVLLTVDEACNTPYMRVFCHEFSSFIRKKFDIYLLMTGLHENIDTLSNVNTLTFLLRAPRIFLQPLDLYKVALAYKRIFDITVEEATALAKWTQGYAYAFQLLGNILFESGKTTIDDAVLEDFDASLRSGAYSKIYASLTPTEQKVLIALAKSNTNQEAMDDLGMKKANFSMYKRKLADAGLLNNSNPRTPAFVLPRFGVFLLFQSYLEEE